MEGPPTEQAEQGLGTITEPADAVALLAAVPEGVSFVNMNKSVHELASRLHTATEDLKITANMSGNEEDYYYYAAIRYVQNESTVEDVPSDGWSVDAADHTKEIFAVFGLNSSETLARECLVSFMVAQKTRSAKRPRHTSGAFADTDCKFPLDFALRTGDFVIYEPSHLSGVYATRQLVRGMILSFLVYTPSISGEEDTMTEFNKQTVVFAYVYTSVLRNNYLVVRVRLNRLPMPHNSPDHSPTPHRLCT